MFSNYLKIAFRNLWRNKTFSLINIFGLALGIAVFVLIFQYIAFEWSANRFNKNYDRLYRADFIYKEGAADYYIPPGFAPVLKDKFPGFQNYVRVADGIGSGIVNIKRGDRDAVQSFREENISYVEGDYLNVFSFPVINGSTSLTDPKTVALSETSAKKYFGNINVAGKIITINNQFGKTPFTIAGVYKDMPAQSDIKADLLISLSTLESKAGRNGNDWADPNGLESGFTNIYFLLKANVNADLLQKQVTGFIHSIKPGTKSDNLVLQPFNVLHLAPGFNYNLPTFGSLLLVIMLLGIGVLILIIAWVNYINLSTAQALNRAKEVGVRKVLGANRFQLMAQHLAETFLLTVVAVAIAFVLVSLFQPLFNNFTGEDLSNTALNAGWFWPAGFAFILAGSLLSGSYVAFVLSSFKPLKTIRGKVENVAKGFSLRKGLVVFQFTISVVFIIATIILYKQLQFMQTEDLGMSIRQRLVIKGPTGYNDDDRKSTIAFKNELSQLPFVERFAASNNVPGQGYNFSASGITKLNPQPGDEKKNFSMLIIDDKYFDAYDIKFVQGKNFTANDAQQGWAHVQKVVINEKASEQLGFSEDENVAGKKILWNDKEYEITGIIKDYHHLSLHQPIEPAVYLPSASQGYFTILTGADGMQLKLSKLKSLFQYDFPSDPFEYFFADELYDQQYRREQRLGNVFVASACIAIFIACMGLFGLAAFSARQRIKEIGIRKVLGAGIRDIALLLSKDFIRLVLISIVIASPVAWWAMNKWLQNFAYRTDISWWIFLLAAAIAISIALLTVSYQSIKAAIANPVENLRAE